MPHGAVVCHMEQGVPAVVLPHGAVCHMEQQSVSVPQEQS